MNDSPTSFFMQPLSRFTYPQKFLIICAFFAFSVFISTFSLTQTQNQGIRTVKKELRSIEYQKEHNKLLEKLMQYEIEVQRYLRGDKPLKSDIENLQNQILIQLNKFEEIDKTMIASSATQNDTLTHAPYSGGDQWEKLFSHTWEETNDASFQEHYALVKELLMHSSEVTENSTLILASENDTYYLAVLLVDLIPEAQVDIPQIIILSEMLAKGETGFGDIRIKLAGFSSILSANLEKARIALKSVERYNDASDETKKAFKEYTSTIQQLTQAVHENIARAPSSTEEVIPVEKMGAEALSASFTLWLKISDIMEDALKDKLSSIEQDLFYTVILTSSGSILGLALGFFIMKQISQPLMLLIAASSRLEGGDLSARVPVNTSDEVGQVGEAFNRMAESLQELIGRLQWTGIQLTTSTTEISAAAKQQESSIVEQEATTKQIAVTAKEISTTAKDFARTMSDVSTTAEQTSSLAAAGRKGLGQMEGIMGEMVEASKNIASKLAVLSEKAGNITSVITTITKVADQTNLLSLNAAIEAEKAGEHGRSFSVIAKEIRRLADQTANATLDIEKMVNEIVSAVSAGVMGVDKFSEVIHSGVSQASTVGGQLTKIIEQVQQLTKSFEVVNQGMQAQSIGAEQINESISQLSDTARQTTESILHFHKAIEELNNAAQEMQMAVSKIKR